MGVSLSSRLIDHFTLIICGAGCVALLWMFDIIILTRAGIAVCFTCGMLLAVCEGTGSSARVTQENSDSNNTGLVETKTCEHALAQLGQQAAGVAHELNNPLGGILMYANLIAEDMDHSDPSYANLEKIIHEAERCRSIVKRLLDIARQAPPSKTIARIDEVLNEALATIRPSAERIGVRLHEDIQAQLPAVNADSYQLQEVFENLLSNAIEAIDGPGDVFLATHFTDDGTSHETVEISVIDTGPGIAKEDIQHLFEPFYTTKRDGHGTGLGLTIACSIIGRYGGTINAANSADGGAVFTVRIPAGREES